MYSLDELFQLLEVVHKEGLEIIYNPSEGQRTEFGFGRANGILQTVMRIKSLLEETENQRAEKQRQRELME